MQGEIQTSSGHRRMTESDPQPTKAGLKSRNAAPPAMLRCAILSGSMGGIGSETARVHHAARRHGGRVAARGARAAASIAGDRNFGRSIARDVWAVIYAIGGTEVALAAKGATQIIPIVITIGGDPVKAGIAGPIRQRSLARLRGRTA